MHSISGGSKLQRKGFFAKEHNNCREQIKENLHKIQYRNMIHTNNNNIVSKKQQITTY